MDPQFAELADELYREKVRRARAISPEEKLLAGRQLFEYACNIARSGIRIQHPEADEAELVRWLRKKDREDMETLLAVQSDAALDWDYIHRWADTHGTRAALDAIRQSLPPLDDASTTGCLSDAKQMVVPDADRNHPRPARLAAMRQSSRDAESAEPGALAVATVFKGAPLGARSPFHLAPQYGTGGAPGAVSGRRPG